MSDDEKTQEQQASELEREERRLERLRLVAANAWPSVDRPEDEPPAAA
jgi:hypothetical protein